MKIIYLIIGFMSLFSGVLGATLPLLPSTPFLLISAFCFAKSSEKLNKWLKNTKIYKDNLENFSKNKTLTLKTKIRILTTVTLLLSVALYFMRNVHFGFLIIFTVWICHIIGFVFFVKTEQ